MRQTPIGWTGHFNINPGKADAVRGIVKELVPAVEKAEPGTVAAEWFVSDDDRRLHFHVWCADQAALIAHATGVGPSQFLPRLMEHSKLERFDVFGTPNEQLAKILEAFPVTSRNKHVAGFTR